MRPEVRSLRRAMSNSSQYVSLCKHSNLLVKKERMLIIQKEEIKLSVYIYLRRNGSIYT